MTMTSPRPESCRLSAELFSARHGVFVRFLCGWRVLWRYWCCSVIPGVCVFTSAFRLYLVFAVSVFYISLVSAPHVYTILILGVACPTPAVPSTTGRRSLCSFALIPGGCALCVARLHGVRLQNALCACVATPLSRVPTLRSLCTLWTHPPPSHAAPVSPRELFFLMQARSGNQNRRQARLSSSYRNQMAVCDCASTI
jgi:hypothetical protein